MNMKANPTVIGGVFVGAPAMFVDFAAAGRAPRVPFEGLKRRPERCCPRQTSGEGSLTI
jgi:hypothetical protein